MQVTILDSMVEACSVVSELGIPAALPAGASTDGTEATGACPGGSGLPALSTLELVAETQSQAELPVEQAAVALIAPHDDSRTPAAPGIPAASESGEATEVMDEGDGAIAVLDDQVAEVLQSTSARAEQTAVAQPFTALADSNDTPAGGTLPVVIHMSEPTCHQQTCLPSEATAGYDGRSRADLVGPVSECTTSAVEGDEVEEAPASILAAQDTVSCPFEGSPTAVLTDEAEQAETQASMDRTAAVEEVEEDEADIPDIDDIMPADTQQTRRGSISLGRSHQSTATVTIAGEGVHNKTATAGSSGADVHSTHANAEGEGAADGSSSMIRVQEAEDSYSSGFMSVGVDSEMAAAAEDADYAAATTALSGMGTARAGSAGRGSERKDRSRRSDDGGGMSGSHMGFTTPGSSSRTTSFGLLRGFNSGLQFLGLRQGQRGSGTQSERGSDSISPPSTSPRAEDARRGDAASGSGRSSQDSGSGRAVIEGAV